MLPACESVQGANQAVAAARLSNVKGNPVRFICRFGNDSYADMLQKELASSGVDLSGCAVVHDLGSGQGIVMLEPDGAASSIVVGGANTAWDKVRGLGWLYCAKSWKISASDLLSCFTSCAGPVLEKHCLPRCMAQNSANCSISYHAGAMRPVCFRLLNADL